MLVSINNKQIELNIEEDTFIPEDIISLQKTACKTPGLIARYGEILAELKAETEKAKFTLDEVSSFVADSTRQKESEKRLTSDRLKEIIALDSRVKDARLSYVHVLRDMHAVENTIKALFKKADIITTLLYQHRQEMKAYSNNL